MQHALELALALTRQHDEAGLCDWLLETMQAARSLKGCYWGWWMSAAGI